MTGASENTGKSMLTSALLPGGLFVPKSDIMSGTG
jgi:hypothetical protein